MVFEFLGPKRKVVIAMAHIGALPGTPLAAPVALPPPASSGTAPHAAGTGAVPQAAPAVPKADSAVPQAKTWRFVHLSDIHFGQEVSSIHGPHHTVRQELIRDCQARAAVLGNADGVLVNGQPACRKAHLH